MPPGWTVEHVEYRGYDSPDRELVARHPKYAPACIGVGTVVRDDDRELLRKEAWLRHPLTTTIYVDVDEVLADWLGALLYCVALPGWTRERLAAAWAEQDPRTWDVFSVLPITEAEGWALVHAEGPAFWAWIEPYPWARELVSLCESLAPTTLLTSASKHWSSYAGKAQWIAEHFPGVDHWIGRGCKGRHGRPGALLIDDSPKNCAAFRERGGEAILFPGLGNELHALANDPMPHVREQLANLRFTSNTAPAQPPQLQPHDAHRFGDAIRFALTAVPGVRTSVVAVDAKLRSIRVVYRGSAKIETVRAALLHDSMTGQSLRPAGYDLFVVCAGE
jgi:5'(3')-deoxyribonucleotidase